MGGFLRTTLRGPYRRSAVRSALDGLRVHRTLTRHGVRPLLQGLRRGGRIDAARARRVSAAVDAGLGLLPVRVTCLRRSMTLLRELDRLRLEAAMHIGVKRGADALEAHAWVQVGGEVINDDPSLVAAYTEISVGDVERLTSQFS